MQILNNFALKKFNSFGIDAMTRYFSNFKTIDDARELLDFRNRIPGSDKLPLLILGGGSNILFTGNFNGIVLKNEIGGIDKVREDNDYVYVKAGAGINWHAFVLHCIGNHWAGIENLSLIPGNAGASPMQNIGAYGVEIKDVFHQLEALDIESGSIVRFSATDCEFGYRESVFKKKFKNRFVIVSVTFRLHKKPVYNTSYGAIAAQLDAMGVQELSIKAISDAVISIRSSKLPDPAVIGNAGSFFKNPEVTARQFDELKKSYPSIVGYPLENGHTKLAAGWLIEQCGPTDGVSWKGYRQGDAGCHSKQALVLVNYGAATGSEIIALSKAITSSIKEKFDVEVEREVNII